MWLPQSQLNGVISITTQCGYFYRHLMWLLLSPPKCGYFYHNSMWLSPSPLNVVISITTIAGKFIFVSNFAIALHGMPEVIV